MPAKKTPLSLDEIRKAKRAPRKTVLVKVDDKTEVEFVFRGIGRKAFDDLAAANPSDDSGLNWDPETFAPALVAASCEQPKMSEQDVREIWDDPEWSYQECDQLFAGALSVNATFGRR